MNIQNVIFISFFLSLSHRNKESLVPVTRRLSGGSDSSTTSSKGSCSLQRGGGEEVVLLVNRKEGRHAIERVGGQDPFSAPRPPQTRTKNPRPTQSSQTSLRHSPLHRTTLSEQSPESSCHPQNSHSTYQDKMPSSRSCTSDMSQGASSQHDLSNCLEDLRAKKSTSLSTRGNGGNSWRQISTSASTSPAKGASCSRSGSPAKKGLVTPRPPSSQPPPSGKGKLLPPVSQPGRHSPQSAFRSSHHHHNHPPRSPRSQMSRTSSRAQRSRSNPRPALLTEPLDDLPGLGYSLQHLPSLDPQREEDLYRSFEAEYLANTRQQLTRSGPDRGTVGKDMLPESQQLQEQHFTLCVLPTSTTGDLNVTDSAYSSSCSSTSSGNVGGKALFPDLREVKKSKQQPCALNDPTTFLQNQTLGILSESKQLSDCDRGLKRLPAISSVMQECELGINSQLPHPEHVPRPLNGSMGLYHRPTEISLNGQPDPLSNKDAEANISIEEFNEDMPYSLNHNPNNDLPLLNCLLPGPPLNEDCLLHNSCESPPLCFGSPLSDGLTSPSYHSLAGGDLEKAAALWAKRGPRQTEWIPSSQRMKVKPQIRRRTDNRPENSPSRIPTPVGRDVQQQQQHDTSLPPLHTSESTPISYSSEYSSSRKVFHQAITDLIHPQSCSPSMGPRDCSYSPPSNLDTEACM